MHITMLSTRRGSPDGFAVREYVRGQTYDLTHADSLARRFLRAGWAYNATPVDPAAEFDANRDAALALAEGNTGLTAFLDELSASAVRMSKERVVQNPATLLATGEL